MKPAVKSGHIPVSMSSITGGMDGIARAVWHRDDYAESIRVITEESQLARAMLSFDQDRRDWIGCSGHLELLENFRKGKPGLISPDVLTEISRLTLDRMEKRAGISTHLAQAGDEVDVTLFLTGEPECMLATQWECEKPSVTLHFMPGVSHTVKHGDMVAHGLAVSAAIMALEAAGYAVEVIAWTVMHPMPWNHQLGTRWPDDTHTKALRKPKEKASKKNPDEDLDPDNVRGIQSLRSAGWTGGFIGHGVLIKEANEPVHAAEMGFYLCHPSFIRGAVYTVADNGNGSMMECTGYAFNGFPVHWIEELKQLSAAYARINGGHAKGIWIPRMEDFMLHERKAEDAVEMAEKILEKMGFIEFHH